MEATPPQSVLLAEPRWEVLKKQEENTRLAWFLLAAGKYHDVKEAKPKLPEGKGQKDFRRELVPNFAHISSSATISSLADCGRRSGSLDKSRMISRDRGSGMPGFISCSGLGS